MITTKFCGLTFQGTRNIQRRTSDQQFFNLISLSHVSPIINFFTRCSITRFVYTFPAYLYITSKIYIFKHTTQSSLSPFFYIISWIYDLNKSFYLVPINISISISSSRFLSPSFYLSLFIHFYHILRTDKKTHSRSHDPSRFLQFVRGSHTIARMQNLLLSGFTLGLNLIDD